MREEGQQVVKDNFEVIKVIPGECTLERRVFRVVKLDVSWFGTDDTNSTASTTVAKFVEEDGLLRLQSTMPQLSPQQSQSLLVLVNLGRLRLQSSGPRQPPQSQNLLMWVKLGFLGLQSTGHHD